MSNYFLKYGILWICAITLAAAACPVDANAQAVISEVMWMGSDMSSADEWIEIANTSTGAVDLSGWEISYLSSGEEKIMFTFPEEFNLSAEEFGIISNYDLDKSRLSDEPMFISSSISLPNSKLLISLIDDEGNLIDQIDDGVGVPFAGSKSPFASMERIDLRASGLDPDNWRTADQSRGFDDGVEIYGSPGYYEEPKETEEPEEPEESNNDSTQESDDSVGAQPGQIIPNVYISEILPNPEGKDDGEWIEIVNDEDSQVDVSNWIIKRSGDKYNFNDYSLGPKSIAVFMKSETELSLKNSGDTIEIFSGSILIDSFSYPTAHDEVSFGRKTGDKNSFASYCVPTKGELNQVKKLYPRILVESGKKRAEAKVTLNFKAISDHGSLNSASCVWNYDDGFESYKCNPPSHIFSEVGAYAVTLSVETVCGNFEEATEYVEVFEKEKKELKELKEIKEKKDEGVSSNLRWFEPEPELKCTPTTSTGIAITQIFPSPSVGEEWIEIENQTDEIFNLCGWILDDVLDGGSKPWTFEDISIQPSEKIKLMQGQTKISLNNTGDEVWLISSDGSFKTGFEFKKIDKDETFGFAQPILVHSSSSTPGGYWEKDGLDGAEIIAEKKPQPPLERRYKNIIPSVLAEDSIEERVMTGVFKSLNIVDENEAVMRSDDANSMGFEVFVVVIGVISSVGLFALKVLKG